MIVGLRWFSQTNEWMDCLVLVKDEDKERAEAAVKRGIDEFWENDFLPYGDCITGALQEDGILYIIEYMDEDQDEDAWEAYLDEYRDRGIDIDIVLT